MSSRAALWKRALLGRSWVDVLMIAAGAIGLLFSFRGLSAESDRVAVTAAELRIIRAGDSYAIPATTRRSLEGHASTCRADFRRAAVAFALYDLRSDKDRPASDAALTRARDAIVSQLACSPADANAWLLLAVVEQMRGDVPSSVEHLRVSLRLAPREGWIVGRRLKFVCSYDDASIAGLRPLIVADFRTLLMDRQFQKDGLDELICGGRLASQLGDALARLDASARAEFARSGGRKLARDN